MTKAEAWFTSLAMEIPDVKIGKMFSALCLKTPNGKSGAMFWRDNLVVKLSGDDFNTALALEGAKVFEPMEGRFMKEWVQIPFTSKDKWKKYAVISADNARKLPKKIPSKKK